MEKMRQALFCIAVAFSLTAHTAMAEPPKYGSPGGLTHLVGLDGWCLQQAPRLSPYGTLTELSPCEQEKPRQLWRILNDDTIRPRDDRYCLVPRNYANGLIVNNVVVMDCSSNEIRNGLKWTKKEDGTIVHNLSGLVLTGIPGKLVTVEANEGRPSQSWEATEGFKPMEASVKWLYGLCLESKEGENSEVSLNKCSIDNKNQQWALFGDGTIRQSDNKYNCLTSSESMFGALVIMSTCVNKPQQRWNLAGDNINHPNTSLVLDVRRNLGALSPWIVVVDKGDATPSQRWTIN